MINKTRFFAFWIGLCWLSSACSSHSNTKEDLQFQSLELKESRADSQKDQAPFLSRPLDSRKSPIEFLDFLDFFPSLDLPIKIKERDIPTTVTTNLPLEQAQKWICEIKGSNRKCVLTPEDSETRDGIDDRGDWYVIGKEKKQNYYLVLYSLGKKKSDYPVVYLASYTRMGDLISRIPFAGKASDSQALDGELFEGTFTLFETNFEYGHKGDPNYFKWQNRYVYQIMRDGRFLDEKGKKLGDKG